MMTQLQMKRIFLAAGLLLAAATMVKADGNRQCAPRDQVVERLAKKYGETRQSIGLGTNNHLMEVFASDKTGSWTITVTTTAGLTCLLATGQAFETLAEALQEGDDA
ncbi:hypothetical protein C8N44_101216 [Allosediminivita pacifica]|uniref:Uncharacterized protein n=2 Tax=Allosediminivita pacifica TaxID=1267769 RepID=A0A2T6BA13_9RHOB|nr:hypothetical protein C8N44_101216 [Allosediminivita pacifica]